LGRWSHEQNDDRTLIMAQVAALKPHVVAR